MNLIFPELDEVDFDEDEEVPSSDLIEEVRQLFLPIRVNESDLIIYFYGSIRLYWNYMKNKEVRVSYSPHIKYVYWENKQTHEFDVWDIECLQERLDWYFDNDSN